MKTHRYVFARIFVNLAIIIAVCTFLIGVGGGLFRLSEMQSKIADAEYRPTTELLDAVAAVRENLFETRKRVLYSLGITEFPKNLNLSTLPRENDPLASVVLPEHIPDICKRIAERVSVEVEGIKAFHADQFRKSIDQLRQALLEHAGKMKAAFAAPPPPDSIPASVVPVIPISMAPKRFRIFDDPIREDKERLDDIQTMQALLTKLAESSRKEENLGAFAKAQEYLGKASGLLDFEAPQEPAPVIDGQSTASQPSPPELVAKAEIIAAKLGQAEAVLENSLYANWRIEADIERLRNQASKDASLVKQLAETRRAAFRSGWRDASIFVVLALAAAFVILVIADLIRAFLNLSNNTDTLAVATVEREKVRE
ncbi:MAG: hypothetical protein IAE94_00480 [Chthoniobacterales bacterium]|nr:hypothetical protein [Chthoniobacterales bacterium]